MAELGLMVIYSQLYLPSSSGSDLNWASAPARCTGALWFNRGIGPKLEAFIEHDRNTASGESVYAAMSQYRVPILGQEAP